jgi:dienelactone hydrolase
MKTLSPKLFLPCFTLLVLGVSPSQCLAQSVEKKALKDTPKRQGWAKTPALFKDGDPIKEDMKKRLAYYSTSTKRFPWTMTLIRRNKTYEKWELTFPSAIKTEYKTNNTAYATYYRPLRTKKPGAACVVLHHLGGSFEAEEVMAAHMAQQGIAAATLTFPLYGKRKPHGLKGRVETASPKDLLEFGRQAVVDVRRVSDVLRSLPEVKNDKVGVLGVSLGAIIGSLSAGIDGRFNKVILILGGASLKDIFFFGSKEVRSMRRYMDQQGIDREKLGVLLAPMEPLNYAHRIGAKRVLMLNGSRDEIIPVAATKALHKALGKPAIHWYKTGHYGAALHIFNIMRRSLKHLRS